VSRVKVVEEEGNINRDAVDVCFKLRSPSMIMFDMNAYKSDNEIKIVLLKK
jgi:hypothetical protein